MSQKELKFQNHVMQSYKNRGGHARKWSAEFTAGNPDLVCALRPYGVHLIELKHRPEWSRTGVYKNPLTPLQQNACKDYREAGGLAIGGLIVGGTNARETSLGFFHPADEKWTLSEAMWSGYALGQGYDIHALLHWYTTSS
jgi:hypothetical protein